MELRSQQIRLDTPYYAVLLNQRRNLKLKYMCAEVLWYFMRTKSAEYMLQFAPRYTQYLEPNGEAYWAYGTRFVDQLQFQVLPLLRRRPDSRRAIISLWNPEDLQHALDEDVKDVPCITTFQFFIRGGLLEMHTYQRSQDLWVGFPNDIFTFTCVQMLLAGSLGVGCGPFVHTMGSCHYYTKHTKRILEALECTPPVMSSPRHLSTINDALEGWGGPLVCDLANATKGLDVASRSLTYLRDLNNDTN